MIVQCSNNQCKLFGWCSHSNPHIHRDNCKPTGYGSNESPTSHCSDCIEVHGFSFRELHSST